MADLVGTARTVRTRDGRQLGYAQWGDPDGAPVLSLHGTPGCRLNRHPDEDAIAAAGIRLITYDRPGYGQSDRRPGRRVVDCVADVADLIDALGISTFALTGGSGGGPHTLAVAAGLPDRVIRARCLVGVAPYDAEGLDWFAGMDPENVKETRWALAGEDVLHQELSREAHGLIARVAVDPSTMLGAEWQLADADRQVLGNADVQRVMREAVPESFAHGVWGWVDDDLAFISPWGFELADIRVPVEIRYGAQDVLVPAGHGAWLAAHVPGATAMVQTAQGHLADPDTVLELLRTLAHPSG